MLLKLDDRPVIKWVTDRAAKMEGVQEVMVATSTVPEDDALAEFCRSEHIPVFRGSQNDVLDRYVQAARQVRADVVVRLTGDCPFLDPAESARVVKAFLSQTACDYACNIDPPFLPDGLDTEVIGLDCLIRIGKQARELPYREHVTLYIRQHPGDFKIARVTGHEDLSSIRLTLDQAEDYRLLSEVAAQLKQRRQFGHLHEIMAVLRDHPEILQMNRHIQRNEGLQKSLESHPLQS